MTAILDCFLDHLPEGLRAQLAPSRAQVGARLETILAAGRAAWPDVSLSEEHLASHCASLAVTADDPLEYLEALHGDELFVACGAGHGDAAAQRHVTEMVEPEMARLRARYRQVPAEDALQTLQARLFAGASPRILTYSGRGSLRGWLRVVAVRILATLSRQRSRETPADDEFLADHLIESTDPELEYIRRTYVDAYRSAFASAIAELERRDRQLLRLSIVDAVSIDGIGALFSVHRSTAARWLNAARDQLATTLRDHLKRALDIDDPQLESILRLIRSRIDVSVERCLDSADAASGSGDGRPR